MKERWFWLPEEHPGSDGPRPWPSAGEGAKVIIAARRENLGHDVVAEIKAAGGEALYVKTDVTVPEDIENLFNIIREKFGRLDCAYNNAEVGQGVKRLANTTMEQWDAVMNTNLRGVWLCMKYELPIMARQKSGVIVNCSSVAGVRGDEGVSLYSASKHGVLGLTKRRPWKTPTEISALMPSARVGSKHPWSKI